MALKLVVIALVFSVLLSEVYGESYIQCYECSRGSKDNQDKLQALFFKRPNDKSLKRALANVNPNCGSNVGLDNKYVTTCINTVCQIVYTMHDPNLTVISSCQSGDMLGDFVSDQYNLVTCVDDLCNNNAVSQDTKVPDNGSIGLITHFSFLSLVLFLFKF